VRHCELDSFGSGQEPVAACCEQGNELSGYIKDGNFLTSLVTISVSERTSLHGVS
jgi:hypothetical protein